MDKIGQKGIDELIGRLSGIPDLDMEKVKEHLGAMEALVEAAAEVTKSMITCTCAAHKQLDHYGCITLAISDDASAWLKQNVIAVLRGTMEDKEFFKQLVMYIEKRTVKHLEDHVPNFTDPQRRTFE